jgi:hypothetical protein
MSNELGIGGVVDVVGQYLPRPIVRRAGRLFGNGHRFLRVKFPRLVDDELERIEVDGDHHASDREGRPMLCLRVRSINPY